MVWRIRVRERTSARAREGVCLQYFYSQNRHRRGTACQSCRHFASTFHVCVHAVPACLLCKCVVCKQSKMVAPRAFAEKKEDREGEVVVWGCGASGSRRQMLPSATCTAICLSASWPAWRGAREQSKHPRPLLLPSLREKLAITSIDIKVQQQTLRQKARHGTARS